MVLTAEELIDLTGYKTPSKQAAWIEVNFGFKPPRKRINGAVSISREQLVPHRLEAANGSVVEPKWKIS